MADKISDLTGDEREQRIAELKQRMQESARRRRAATEEPEPDNAAAEAPVEVDTPAVEAGPSSEPIAPESDVSMPVAEETVAAPVAESKPASKPAASRPASPASRPAPQSAPAEEDLTNSEMNRREFLTYAWGGALGLLALEGAALSFSFMYPRFKEGEFGGKFILGSGDPIPEVDGDPEAYPDGKFWLVTPEEDQTKALYMVCTHLGCLYKWEDSNGRFECPCHGSKFTYDGDYIEGPAPRSLDSFETDTVDGELVVDTGKRINGEPAADSPANVNA